MRNLFSCILCAVAFFLGYPVSAVYACEYKEKDVPIEDLFELSLQELMNLNISGAAVKDIGFDRVAVTNNPFQLTNCNTPASLEIINLGTIRARGLNNVVEVVESMVGVLSGESPSEPYSFSMRGFTRDSIKVLVNGVSMGRATFNMRPLSTGNLQRVEVIKGPGALESGQGSAGGTINMVSKQAALGGKHNRTVYVSQGNLASAHTVEFNGPISANKAYHFNTTYRAENGRVDDSEATYLSANASMLWVPNRQFKIKLAIDSQQDDLPAYWGTPMIPISVALDPITNVIKTDDNRVIDGATLNNNYNVADHLIDSKSHWKRINMSWQGGKGLESKTTLYEFSAQRQWKNAESYIYNSTSGKLDRDRLYVDHDRQLWGAQSEFTIASKLLQRASSFSLRLEYSDNYLDHFVGFEPIDFFVDDVDIQQPNPGAFNSYDVAGAVEIKKDTLNLITSAAIVSNHTALSRNLDMSVSFKIENLEVDRHFYNFDGSTRSNKTIKETYRQNSYTMGLVYAFSTTINGYAQMSKQHDDIGGDFDSVNDINNFKPSDLTQFEVGLKALMHDAKIETTLALFDIKKESVSEQLAQPVTENEQTAHGLEFAMRANITAQFRMGGNMAYTQAKYAAYYDENTGTDASNNTPVNVPEKMASLWGSSNNLFNLPLEVGAGLNYVSARFANTSNTVTLQSYTLLNLFASYSHNDFRLALHIRNVSDEVYAPWSDIFYPEQVIIAPPRTLELSFQSRF